MRKPGRDAQRRWVLIPGSFLAFWLLGLGFAWWLIVPPLAALSVYRAEADRRTSKLLTVLGIWLILTIAVALLLGNSEVQYRAPGAAFGAMTWLSAGFLVYLLARASAGQMFHFVRGIIFISSAQGLVTLAAVNLHPSPLSSIALPSAQVLLGTGGVAPWTVANLAYTDFFGGGIVRSSGLMATAAWSGGFACLVLLMLLLYRQRLLEAGLSKFEWLCATALSAASLFYSYSRVSWAILVAGIGIYLVFRAFSRLVSQAGPALAVCTLTPAIALVFAYTGWQEYLLEQDALRPGSSTARFESYTEGFEAATSQGPFVLLAGSGVKPLLEELGRGAGSESTYMSLLVRGGLIAVGILLAFLVWRFRQASDARDWAGVIVIAGVAVHALIEDLDVGTLTLLLLLVDPARIAGYRWERKSKNAAAPRRVASATRIGDI